MSCNGIAVSIRFAAAAGIAPADHEGLYCTSGSCRGIPAAGVVCGGSGTIPGTKKAAAVSAQHPKDLVLGSDTMVLLGDQILGKPGTPERAAEMLRLLSGKTHRVITGVALARGGVLRSFQSETAVTFYPLSEEEIAAYVATGEPLDKAGGYGIQGYGALLVKEIAGDFYSVMGLPVAQTARMLAAFPPANP